MSEQKTTLFKEDLWADLLLFSLAFFLLFWALGDRGLWTSEGRWAEITREMLLTKDFFHPTIGGEPYFDKPFLSYWLIAIVSLVAGTLNELIVRLPSAIAGVAAIWATLKIGTRLWSAQTGRVAAWILLTTYGFLFWSRTGTSETENLAAVILAVAWYWSRREQPGFITFLVFYSIAFVGALTKGLTAVVIPVLAVLPDILQDKRWRALLKPSHFLALALAITVYLSPFFYASLTRPASYNASGLGLVFQENILRYFKPIDHKGPIYLYLYSIPLLLLPWTPLWLAATAGTVRIWNSLDDKTRWLAKAVALIFLFFTLSGSRRSYYILPILPFCSLLTAVFVVRIRNRRTNVIRRWGMGIQRDLFIILALFELIGPLALVILKPKIGFGFPAKLYVVSIIIGILALMMGIVAYRYLHYFKLESKADKMIVSLIVIATLLLGGFFCWQQSILNAYETERPFALAVKARTADLPPENIGFIRKNNAKFLFYLDTERPTQTLREIAELRDFLAKGQGRVLISQRRYVSEAVSAVLGDLAKEPDMSEEIRPWDSKSSRGEKWVAWFITNEK